MPSNNNSGYSYKSSGTNSQVRSWPLATCGKLPAYLMAKHHQGNHYCARDYGSSAANSNSYHYSNT